MKIARLLLLATILSYAFGIFGSFTFGSGVRLYWGDFFAAVLVGWGLLYFLGLKKKFTFPQPCSWWGMLFSGVALLSLILGFRQVNQSEWLIGSLYFLRWALYFAVFLVASNLFREGLSRFSLTRWLVAATFLYALFGFVQLLVLPDFTVLDPELGWDPHQNRLASTFFDPNFSAALLGLGLFLSLSQLMTGVLKGWRKTRILVVSGVLAGAILLTFSRSGWAMVAIGCLVFGFLKSKKILVAGLVLMILAYFLVPRVQTRISGLTDPTDSAHLRIQTYQRGLTIVRNNIFLGVGFNLYRQAQEREGFFTFDDPTGGHSGAGADSSLLLVLATTGVVGLFFYLGLLGSLLHQAWRSWRDRSDILSLSFLAITGGLVISSFFVNTLFFPAILVYWWLLAAATYEAS
ncbi:MAG: O-antigen ligase family protein [bacterium]|nr:O-antigen ligase family protein [bacterium]